MPKEYTKFGDQVLQREEGTTADWEPVPLDDLPDAKVEIRVAEEMRKRNRETGAVRVSQIIRAPRNEEIAAKLGLNADELATRLAKPDENQGTRTRVSDAEFNTLMGELGLTPEEARKRFTGEHWPQ